MQKLLTLLTVALITSCASAPIERKTAARSVASEWPPAYESAIHDALNPEPAEVVHDLIPIIRENPDLTWMEIDGDAYVLMVSLVGDPRYYEPSLGGTYNTGTHYIWVTTSPELKAHCVSFSPETLDTRLRQILGLTPNASVSDIVEFWVKPGSLFRPAADNEITDQTAGLDIPDSTPPWYRRWFNDLRSHQYFQSEDPRNNAYPWTQLGYTYDWGLDDHQGLSEFVINTNSDVLVEAISPVATYCR